MVGNQEEERKSVYFSRQKNVKGGVLIFVVADIWNCYNMDMFIENYSWDSSGHCYGCFVGNSVLVASSYCR